MKRTPVRVIHNDHDHEEAVREIEELLRDASDEAQERLDVLTILVNDYENAHHELPEADPVDVLKFVMEQQGLRQRDLVQYLGSRPRVSEVLNGTRPLTLPMIRRLSAGLNVPVRLLVGGCSTRDLDEPIAGETRLAPVQLRDWKVLSLHCETNEEFKEKLKSSEEYTLSLQFSAPDKEEKPAAFPIAITVTMEKKNEGCRYNSVHASSVGHFCAGLKPTQEKFSSHVIPNCISLLYGAVRGYLSGVLGNFMYGPVVIPAIPPGAFCPADDGEKIDLRKTRPRRKKEPSSSATASTAVQ